MPQIYLEDIFTNFFDSAGIFLTGTQDYNPAENFYLRIKSKELLTKKQAMYAERILEKYKESSAASGFDYTETIKNASWREKFREIDLSKSVILEKSSSGEFSILVKFPYSLKNDFDKQFSSYYPWSPEKKARVVNFYNADLIKLSEFVIKHEFSIDQSFIDVLEDVESISENRENFIPHSKIVNGSIKILNCSEETQQWFDQNCGSTTESQIFTAKIMGYPLVLEKNEKSVFEKIVSSKNNNFYINDVNQFFNVYEKISGKAAIFLDRSTDAQKWITNFLKFSENWGIPRSKIKVCFRENESSKQTFNQWIKENDLGGKVSEGDIYIFQNTLPKWLFSSENSVKIVLTNLVHPATSTRVQEWLSTQPCVMYSGQVAPSMPKGIKIEKL